MKVSGKIKKVFLKTTMAMVVVSGIGITSKVIFSILFDPFTAGYVTGVIAVIVTIVTVSFLKK